LFLTFDDGGASAATHIADLLERRGWRGHFFITAAKVDSPGFVTRAQVRSLRRNGHVIGSHSWSHPTRMALCDWEELHREWTRSVTFLSELLGERVVTASVPGGYYSPRVASAAAAAGIDVLFTSEPHKRIVRVDGCLVLGRYWLLRGMPASSSADLATATLSSRQLQQLLLWNSKKVLKRLGGKRYLAMRDVVLRRRHSS
jgi:peptidoglycan/xylan/chitin deacetylase (PgdA/CDA1 family)